jgi:hypothetical protein
MRAGSYNDIDPSFDQLRRIFGNPIGVLPIFAILDREVLALNEVAASHVIENGNVYWRFAWKGYQEAETISSTRLLRARRDRPRSRAPEQRDDFPSPHWLALKPMATTLSHSANVSIGLQATEKD